MRHNVQFTSVSIKYDIILLENYERFGYFDFSNDIHNAQTQTKKERQNQREREREKITQRTRVREIRQAQPQTQIQNFYMIQCNEK